MPDVNAPRAALPQPVAVIDDDSFVRSVVTAALNAAGIFDVYGYSSGEAAIADLETLQPQLVLMDCVLPGMSGPAAWKIMRERMASGGRPARLILLTARNDDDLMKAVPDLCGIVAKPFDPLTLVERLGDILGLSMSPSPVSASSLKLADVAAKFRATLPDTAQAMTVVWDNIRGNGWHAPLVQALLEQAHKLAGTAGLFGVHAVGASAEAVESLLLQYLARDTPPGRDDMERLTTAINALTAACRSA